MGAALVADTPLPFKPFLVQGVHNIFRVLDVGGGVSFDRVRRLLEQLPFTLAMQKDLSPYADRLEEPVEVYVRGALVYLYPPKGRMLACTTLNSWQAEAVVSRMHVDNVMDMQNPGRGQIRTCIHFDPNIFGIAGWPESVAGSEIEVDIHVHPKGKVDELQIEPPSVQVRDLLELIAGGEKPLTRSQLSKWSSLIMYGVQRMRAAYMRQPKEYPVRVYYEECWARIDAAHGDDQKMVEALEHLRSSIEWQ